MKSSVLINCAVVVVICGAIAMPLVAWHNAAVEADARDASLRRQKQAIDELSAAIAKRKNEIAGKSANALTDEQLKELLRLRAEAGALRRQTNDIAKLRAENDKLQKPPGPGLSAPPKSRDELVRELSGELMGAAKTILAELPAARRKFAEENHGESARQLSELRRFFPQVDGGRMRGLYSFEFVHDTNFEPVNTLILGEIGEHLTPEGLPAKIYAFSDGQVVEIKAPARENAFKFFEEWEKQHWSPPSQGQ